MTSAQDRQGSSTMQSKRSSQLVIHNPSAQAVPTGQSQTDDSLFTVDDRDQHGRMFRTRRSGGDEAFIVTILVNTHRFRQGLSAWWRRTSEEEVGSALLRRIRGIVRYTADKPHNPVPGESGGSGHYTTTESSSRRMREKEEKEAMNKRRGKRTTDWIDATEFPSYAGSVQYYSSMSTKKVDMTGFGENEDVDVPRMSLSERDYSLVSGGVVVGNSHMAAPQPCG